VYCSSDTSSSPKKRVETTEYQIGTVFHTEFTRLSELVMMFVHIREIDQEEWNRKTEDTYK
jgi:hypothetical protein